MVDLVAWYYQQPLTVTHTHTHTHTHLITVITFVEFCFDSCDWLEGFVCYVQVAYVNRSAGLFVTILSENPTKTEIYITDHITECHYGVKNLFMEL